MYGPAAMGQHDTMPSRLRRLIPALAALAAWPIGTPARAQAPGGPPPKVTVAKPVTRETIVMPLTVASTRNRFIDRL